VVPAGSTVALVGPSGAGKTTIAHLFLRFWDPDKGAARLDGHDLRDYRLDDLRRRVALVAQDTYLFNDTLRANVLLARPGASGTEVETAIEQAALAEFVTSLPDGLDTIVGERGTRLSGGQRQRVAIARALVNQPSILLADEPTGNLDSTTSEEIMRVFEGLAEQGQTVIMVTHEADIAAHARRVILLRDGLVASDEKRATFIKSAGIAPPDLSRSSKA
jgi:ATP-binding cassette subfamily C protein CydCD